MRKLSLLLLLFFAWIGTSTAQNPNIVLIVADDLGYGDLSAYGAEDLQSPALDSLAASGIQFNQFYANSSVCSPTRAALLSGRYPPLVGVPGVIRTHASDNWGHLSKDAKLLPELLRNQGYHTAMIGKWHLGLNAPQRPIDRGFEHFEGFLGDMMDDYYHHQRHGLNYMRRGEEVIRPTGHATDLFTDWAVNYIESRTASPAPFFLYLAYNAPHTPIQPPDEWITRIREREPHMNETRAKLVALIEHMDDGIGRVLASLEENGFHDDTIVIFISDNGGQLNVGANNGLLREGKGTMYEGGLRIPAIISWPGHSPSGMTSDALLTTMDLYPTLLEVAQARTSHVIDGISFLPLLLNGKKPDPERTLFFSRREGNLRFGGKTIEAVRKGPWKLLQNSPYTSLELYHLERDPLETTNLASTEPDIFRQLATMLRQYIQDSGRIPWQ
ncbi:MAG: sulfatase-like hydrolase/transferase [Bacteroidetes bacterium]|nr:sulfatase-like hydrolase/transferase [Bacteroidota bacterium]MCY4206115.1 sulfatase-like hydrolase/transferase [Bacteroidota bacterium]